MRRCGLIICSILFVGSVFAQEPARGFPPYGSFQDGQFDSVNLENLNVSFSIPIVSVPGRGLNLSHALTYNSLIWYQLPNGYGKSWYWADGMLTEPGPGNILYDFQEEMCNETEVAYHYYNYRFEKPDGTVHNFGLDFYDTPTFCNFWTGPTAHFAEDGSGYFMDATDPLYPIVYTPAGVRVWNVWPGPTMMDTNGNASSHPEPGWGAWTNYTDTLGRVALKFYKATPFYTYFEYKFQDANGTYQTARVNYQSFQIKTVFGCPGVVEWNQSGSLPVSLVLPNGRSYSFTYEETPGWPGYTTARLKRVTLPTGGYYEYQYPTTGNKGINCEDATVTSLTRIMYDGTASAQWDYSRTKIEDGARKTWKTVVTAPQLPYDSSRNESVYTFTTISYPYAKETSEKHYQGSEASGQPLRTVNTTFNCDQTYNGGICTPTVKTIIAENNWQTKIEPVFDAFNGNLKEERLYDWGDGAPGPLLRKTTITYLTGAPYTDRNILNRVTQTKVVDGAGTVVAQADILYDETMPICTNGTPAPQHDYGGYGCSFNVRGNPTTIRKLVGGTNFVTTTNTYDDLGNVRSTTDPGGHTTTFSYADSYSDGVNRNSFAYVTQVTKPAPFSSQTTQLKYYFPTGQLYSITDENSRITTFEYVDTLKRPTRTNFPDGGQITIAYSDTLRTITATQKRTASESVSTVEVYDQLGRLSQQQLPGGRKVDTTYDLLGRAWKVSNPYVTTGEPTYGVVETRFDALGREKIRLNQDGTSSQTEYTRNAIRISDEAGKQRLSQTDALGRLTKVCEVTAGNARSPAESCGITGFGGLGYPTAIAYTQDATENVTQIAQGIQTRILRHDKLDRIKSAKIIEVNTATELSYGYDNDGNRTGVTDPRGTVTLEYDELHRLKRKRHGTTVVASYSYDGTQANNAIGRLIAETDGDFGSGADKTEYTYDPMGRVLTANRTVSGTTYAMSYAYDYMGDLTRINYPSASGIRRLVEYSYNAAAELFKATDITSTPFDYVSNTTYAPLGLASQIDLGNSVRTTLAWNNRQVLSSLLTQKVGSSSFLSLSYTYFGNGQIEQIINNLDNLKSEKFTYDELHRVLTAQRGPDASVQRKYQYDYDRYGNRWGQTLVAGSGYNTQLSFDMSNNHVNSAGFSYDGSGNLTANNTPYGPFSYNQENFMATAGTSTYQFDVQGRRVRKTVGGAVTDYFYSGGVVISEKQGSQWTDYVFFGDQRIAKQTGSTGSTASYIHPDHLGSTRVCTDSNGNSTGSCDYEPFGESQSPSGCSLPTNYRFAGMEWDQEAGPMGLYHTWFRQYDPSQGRWMTVDPLAGSPDDPQSIDRYVYVLNDGVNLSDPLGLQGCTWDGIQVPCSWVREALASGAGVVGPEGPEWVDTPNDPGCRTNLAMDVKWCPRDAISSLPLRPPFSVPTEQPVEPTTPQERPRPTCITRIMLVTAYSDVGPGSDWSYFKPKRKGGKPRSVGPGIVAVANTDPLPYPYGSVVTVVDRPTGRVEYRGRVHDTGAGWDAQHHDVLPEQWIDIWLPRKKALAWGAPYRTVTICH